MTATLPHHAIKTGTWTIENTASGEHRTFRITRRKAEDASFAPGKRIVELMTGSDNENSYTGFGFAEANTIRVWSSKRGQDKPASFDFFASMLGDLMGGENRMGIDWAAKGYELRGEARCCVCGRKLTTPESLDAGIGPVCAGR